MDAIIIQSDGIVEKLTDAGIDPTTINEVEAKGLAGEVVSAALLAFGTGVITAIAKVIVELIKREKKFSVTLNGKQIEFSGVNINHKEVEALLKSFKKNNS